MDPISNERVDSEAVIGELVSKKIVLLAMAIDPHSQWGPITDCFLFGLHPATPMRFENTRHPKPNAQRMYNTAIDARCPPGIIPAASAAWRPLSSRKFYGHSYLAPTPREHTLQQLGLAITKAYSYQLRHAIRRMTDHTPSPRRLITATPDRGYTSNWPLVICDIPCYFFNFRTHLLSR